MSDTLSRVLAFFKVDPTAIAHRRMPIEIPNVGRKELAQCFAYCGFRVGAEIGVEQGAYAEQLCVENPGLSLHCVDAWAPYRSYREHVSAEKLEGFYAATQKRLKPFQVTFHRAWSIDAAKTFKDGSLDFVYIDANHRLDHVVADLYAWVPKVRGGGILAGHDFVRRKKPGLQVHVVEAVTAYTQANHIHPWFVLGSKDVSRDVSRDSPRSWFWVVP